MQLHPRNLLIIASSIFLAHPGIDKLFATADENVFLPDKENLAKLHAKETHQELRTIHRSEVEIDDQPQDGRPASAPDTTAGQATASASATPAKKAPAAGKKAPAAAKATPGKGKVAPAAPAAPAAPVAPAADAPQS